MSSLTFNLNFIPADKLNETVSAICKHLKPKSYFIEYEFSLECSKMRILFDNSEDASLIKLLYGQYVYNGKS